jgi:hypothetical protein
MAVVTDQHGTSHSSQGQASGRRGSTCAARLVSKGPTAGHEDRGTPSHTPMVASSSSAAIVLRWPMLTIVGIGSDVLWLCGVRRGDGTGLPQQTVPDEQHAQRQ